MAEGVSRLQSYTTTMMRLAGRTVRWMSSGTGTRRANFFELNPIFPDRGQKDFDIYNTDYNHIHPGNLAISEERRTIQLKEKLTQDVLLKPANDRAAGKDRGDYEVDQETGLPLGIHEDFDTFIEVFKRERKVGGNVEGEFSDLTVRLMRQFEAKSEVELVKLFRLNIAAMRRDSLRDKLRGLLFNSAFIRFVTEKKTAGKQLTLGDLQPFMDGKRAEGKTEARHVSQQQLEEVAFRSALEEIDQKIARLESEVHSKAVADGSFVPTYHPRFGEKITEESKTNMNFDVNHPRGHVTQVSGNAPRYTGRETQDAYIAARLNRLFFVQALGQVQRAEEVEPEKVMGLYDLPLHVRKNDKAINSLLYKYKEYEMLVEPDIEDIYREVDVALKKIAVKVVPSTLANAHENATGQDSGRSVVKERVVNKEAYLWNSLDVEQIFDPEHYQDDTIEKVRVEEREVDELSPSPVLEMSLNKMPFNLHRHQDLEYFTVFTKYRKQIYRDYVRDATIDPRLQFKFFSLEQAKNTLKRVKRGEELVEKYYGHATRKSSEAEVFLTKGTGKVTINKEPLADYCGDVYHRGEALKPLIYTERAGEFDCEFTVVGGGIHGQAECMAMALAKAMVTVDPKYEEILYGAGLIGTDDRRKEPKRMNLYSARKRPPYVRR